MNYIKGQPDTSGNHGNPMSRQLDGMVELPDALLNAYITTMGFASLTIANGVVTNVTVNQTAYDAYKATHKDRTWIAEKDMEPGEYVTVNKTMYKVLLPIFAGAQITPGTNVEATTIEAELAALTEEV